MKNLEYVSRDADTLAKWRRESKCESCTHDPAKCSAQCEGGIAEWLLMEREEEDSAGLLLSDLERAASKGVSACSYFHRGDTEDGCGGCRNWVIADFAYASERPSCTADMFSDIAYRVGRLLGGGSEGR